MHTHFKEMAEYKPRNSQRYFNEAFDRLLSRINFGSKKESIRPENVETIKNSFYTFFKEMGWPLAVWSFDDLLDEKIGEHQFRADGKTPNWFHEAREILFFLSHARAGIIKRSDMKPYGGLEVGVSTILRHDSWEDLGKSYTVIFGDLEKRIHDAWGKNGHDDAYFFMLRQKSVMIAHNVDLLTHKFPRIDFDGQYVRKDTGKFVKDDRFNRDLNQYMTRVLESPIATAAKYFDGVEGMSTRNNVPAFNDQANRSYNEERRMIYGRRGYDEEAGERYPFLAKSIKSADSMLGILLAAMEHLVDYSKPQNDPHFARPIRVGKYLANAKIGFNLLPGWAHPICGLLEDLEDKAQAEETPRTALLLKQSFYPALLADFNKPYNYGASSHLLPGAGYAPNVG